MAQWAKEADRVCAEINAEVEALPEPGNDLATFDAYIGRIRQLLTTEQTKIADLDGPDGETPTSMAEYLDRQLELVADLEEAAGDGDGMRVRSLLDQSARAGADGQGHRQGDRRDRVRHDGSGWRLGRHHRRADVEHHARRVTPDRSGSPVRPVSGSIRRAGRPGQHPGMPSELPRSSS